MSVAVSCGTSEMVVFFSEPSSVRIIGLVALILKNENFFVVLKLNVFGI